MANIITEKRIEELALKQHDNSPRKIKILHLA
jgi:hypothetical protein